MTPLHLAGSQHPALDNHFDAQGNEDGQQHPPNEVKHKSYSRRLLVSVSNHQENNLEH